MTPSPRPSPVAAVVSSSSPRRNDPSPPVQEIPPPKVQVLSDRFHFFITAMEKDVQLKQYKSNYI